MSSVNEAVTFIMLPCCFSFQFGIKIQNGEQSRPTSLYLMYTEDSLKLFDTFHKYHRLLPLAYYHTIEKLKTLYFFEALYGLIDLNIIDVSHGRKRVS